MVKEKTRQTPSEKIFLPKARQVRRLKGLYKLISRTINKFCGLEKKYQGLAYGSDSDHCPKQELVTEEIIDSTKAIVKTKFTQ